MTLFTWIGVLLCLSQSAILSGLNLGLFARSRLELEVLSRQGDARAQRVLSMREDSNFALVTILWSNVGVNVLLALLSGSVMGGVAAFLFSTVVITIFAEIIPQSYFSRHSLQVASLLQPVLRIYQFVMWPVARPTAWVLDRWLGGEGIRYFPEQDLHRLLSLHMESTQSDITRVEGRGARNFLELDDVALRDEGESLHPDSIIELPFEGMYPVFPSVQSSAGDAFLQRIHRSGKNWIVLVDLKGEPRMGLRVPEFTCEVLMHPDEFDPQRFTHPLLVERNGDRRLGELLPHFKVRPSWMGDTLVGNDVIVLWNEAPRLISGTDILGRLLRGVGRVSTQPSV